MRAVFRGALGAALIVACSGLAVADQSQAKPVNVYKVGPDVTAPQLLPITFTTTACSNPISGQVKLSVIVDGSGMPQNPMFIRARGDALDLAALNILKADRFKSGERSGSQVPVAQAITINLKASEAVNPKDPNNVELCSQPDQHLSDEDIYPEMVIYAPDSSAAVRHHKHELYRVDGDITPPLPIIETPSIDVGRGSNNSQKAKYEGTVLLSLVVDSTGMPQDVRVIRPLGMGLDEKAVDAVRQARFRPALYKQMQPVPVTVAIRIAFRLY